MRRAKINTFKREYALKMIYNLLNNKEYILYLKESALMDLTILLLLITQYYYQ